MSLTTTQVMIRFGASKPEGTNLDQQYIEFGVWLEKELLKQKLWDLRILEAEFCGCRINNCNWYQRALLITHEETA